ncbi:hypothetical protein BDN72DRAFT_662621 [Pluteus cervinus]|uniref:Uncharacterized protein n=1 Tax=Pluteus cervinus TaxID=181527 RepID=A0ACD3ASZ1_9AGAR|nr:hypothetical protein BDN72DRAFT_662621 [Pluteus cervinus]
MTMNPPLSLDLQNGRLGSRSRKHVGLHVAIFLSLFAFFSCLFFSWLIYPLNRSSYNFNGRVSLGDIECVPRGYVSVFRRSNFPGIK